MPLTKYQIRNEYSLADPELYRAADKDDPEALLEGVAMAGLVGVLRQLGDLAEFAAGIFHDLHEEVMATAARGHRLMIRIQQLEAEVAPIEKAFLSRTSHSLFIYNAGVDWHPNLRTDQIMITRGDLPRFVRDSYEECRGPPRLFLLDKFDIAGAGACLKRYSDPSFFKAQLNFSETTKADFQKEKKTRIVKKKGSRCRNGEKPDVFPTSHAKLHQLFSEERRQNEKNVFMPHVKLKKRQSNGSLFDSTTGKSYMERFLETHSPERKIAYESSLGPLNLNMKSNNSSELGLEIREISTGSPVNKLLRRERGADSSFNRQEAVLESSMYDLYEDAIKEGILENFPESITFIEVEKNPSSFYKAGDQKESMVDLEIKTEAIADGYQSDDINSEVDNYLDALTTMESEMETDIDIRPKYERGFFNTERQGLDSDANEEHQMLQAQFSGTHFIESSSASDDGNNVFKKGRSSFSYSNTLSNLDENPPSDGGGVAKVCTSTETCPTEFIDRFSKELSRDGDALVTESLEYVVPCSSFNEVSENPSYRSELVESSSSSCVTDSSSTLPHLSQGANLNGFELQGPESIEISSDCPKFDLEGSSSNTDADGKNLFGDLPCTTSVSDFSFQMTDYLRPMQFAKGQPVEEMDGRTGEVSSDALWQLSNISDVALEKKYVAKTLDVVSSTECAENGSTETLMNGKLELPHSVTLPTEKQLSVLAGQDLEACSGTTQPERLHGSISPGDLNDGNPDKIVSKTDTSIRTTGANSEYLTSVLDVLDTSDFTEQDFLEMKDEVLPPDLKLENGNGCSGVKALDNNLDVLSNTFESGVKDEPEIDVVQMNSCASVGKAAVPLEFPSICVVSGSPKPATATDFHSQLNNLVNGTVHLEADNDITMCPNLIVGPSGKHMTLQEECPSSNRDLGDLVAEDHSQSDNLVTGIVHAEACGDDTSVCPNLIGSPSKNHVKVLEECPSNLDLGNLLTEANSQLDNLVTGTVDAEADGADTADYPNLNCDLSGNHIKLQEECPSSGDSARYKREIFEACSPKCIIESESRKETNQLAVASTELNFELCNPEFFDPSSSELPNDVHNSLLVEHVQNDFHLMDVTRTSTSLKESDQELKSAHHSYLSESADNSNLSATHSLQEPGVLSEQTLKSEADQLIVGSLHEDGGSFMPFNLRYEPAESLTRRIEDGCVSAPSELSWVISLKEPSEPQFSSTTANHKIDSSETAIDCSDSIVSSIGTFPGTKQPAEPPPSRSVLDLPLPDPEAGQANLEMPPLPPLPPMQWRRIGQLLRQGSLASEGEMVQPSLNPFSPQLAATAHGKAQQGFPTLVGEIAQPLNLFLPLSSLEDKKSQHGSEALRGEMVQAGLNPFSSQLPVMVDDANSQQGSITSEGKRIHPPKPNPILPSPALEDENPQHGSLTSGGEMGQFASLPTIEDTRLAFSLHGQLDEVQNPLASKSITEDGMLEHTSLTKEGVEWPLNSFAPPPTSKDEKPPHGSLTLEGEMVWPSKESALLPTVEVGMPNGNLAKKLPRPRDPLIEAVASHDKSMLRKVTERVQSLSGPNVDERDSLLEQIRAKSFNLKPAATTRPSLHGPKTNLKVAAILEKANAIRQALAGSDEDDDGDNWSDS